MLLEAAKLATQSMCKDPRALARLDRLRGLADLPEDRMHHLHVHDLHLCLCLALKSWHGKRQIQG